jgi:hypothetical protein
MQDLADWAKMAAKAAAEVADSLVSKGVQKGSPLIQVGDYIGDTEEEAKKLKEDPETLAERARFREQMDKLEKAFGG